MSRHILHNRKEYLKNTKNIRAPKLTVKLPTKIKLAP